jgi:hypothetical protein
MRISTYIAPTALSKPTVSTIPLPVKPPVSRKKPQSLPNLLPKEVVDQEAENSTMFSVEQPKKLFQNVIWIEQR